MSQTNSLVVEDMSGWHDNVTTGKDTTSRHDNPSEGQAVGSLVMDYEIHFPRKYFQCESTHISWCHIAVTKSFNLSDFQWVMRVLHL